MKNYLLLGYFLMLWGKVLPYDLTIAGYHNSSVSIGRRAINFINALNPESKTLKINYVDCRSSIGGVSRSKDQDIDPSILEIIHHKDKTPGTVAFFVDLLTLNKRKIFENVPDSNIKLALVTLETTKAPRLWVEAINNKFDGVVVPDTWLVDVLRNSGVVKPVFVVPEICPLEDFLAKPLQMQPHKPFVFGVSALIEKNKNYDLLLDAFAAEFKNAEDVLLKITSAGNLNAEKLRERVKTLGLNNVQINTKSLSWQEYVNNHMSAIDCYVLISKGEGFSMTPRESLALGRPCILSNHTAHQTICQTGFVRPVDALIIEEHDGENYSGERLGNNFNCTIDDVRAALRDVYEHYDQYLHKAHQAREWAAQYIAKNLRALYVSLFKPSRVILGESNEVTRDYLMTNSAELYEKYRRYVLQRLDDSV